MFLLFSRLYNLIIYWYFRYNVVTELYMVEKWERYTIHVIFGLFFMLCWYFNYAVVLTSVGKISMLLRSSEFMDMKTIAMNS